MLEIAVEPAPDPTTAAALARLAATADSAATSGDDATATRALVDAVRRATEGSSVVVEVEPALDAHDRATAAAGLTCARDLLQLRRSLPLDDATRAGALPLVTRPFRPGPDDEAWLAVNNAAFAWHPEQADWTPDDLAARLAEPWFDPDGFLVHEVAGRLAGFCWTKVHADHDPPLGEIFVIAVDPAFHGRGLGRALTVAGLDHLARQGLGVAMLYVEAENEAALGLYRALGFTVHHRHRWYRAPARR